jgi:hypothetical protein
MRRRITLVLASLLAVLALGYGGWLVGPDPSDLATLPAADTASGPVLYDQVTQRMVAERTATYTFSGSSGGGEARSGWGAMRFSSGLDDTTTFDANVELTSPSTGRLQAVLLPGTSYLALPPAKGIPVGAPWLKVAARPSSALGRAMAPLADQLRATFDPRETLGLLLAAGRVTVVGPASVDGTPAVEHRASIDLHEALAEASDPSLRSQFKAMLQAGVHTLRYQLWLDDSGLPLKVRTDLPTAQGVFSVTGVFARWGDPVKIAAPGAKQVYDADQVEADRAAAAKKAARLLAAKKKLRQHH